MIKVHKIQMRKFVYHVLNAVVNFLRKEFKGMKKLVKNCKLLKEKNLILRNKE